LKTRFIRLALNISLSVFFVLMVCCLGQAQSGRRAPKPLSPPTITPPSEESEQPPSQKPTPKQQTLSAGMEASLDIPLYMSDAVWNGFTERFNKVSLVVISGDKNMNRKEASDRAKKATESPVVLLQLSTQAVGGNMGQVNFEDLVVNFTIFAPRTGKVSEQGRVYIGRNRSVLGQRLPTGRNGESQLKEAGRETANRVLSLLHVGDGNFQEGAQIKIAPPKAL
jgi:hypothetical protein